MNVWSMRIFYSRLIAVLAVAVIFAGCAHRSAVSRGDRGLAPEDDLRSKVGEAWQTDEVAFSGFIDPDQSIFGIPIGTTEDEFILKRGKPRGYIRLHDGGRPSGFVRLIGEETAMIYGDKEAFIFESGKLAGIRISPVSLFDWKLANRYPDGKWQLSNGIERDMNLAQVRRILGDKLEMKGNYQYYYRTEKAVVELEFMHWTGLGDKAEAYNVSGILVRYGLNGSEFRTATTIEAAPAPASSGAASDSLGVVGMLVEKGLKFPKVRSVYTGGPADKAGIESGMVILSVDGRNLMGSPMDEAVRLLRGKVGEKVTLEVLNLGNGNRNTVTMTRVPASEAGRPE